MSVKPTDREIRTAMAAKIKHLEAELTALRATAAAAQQDADDLDEAIEAFEKAVKEQTRARDRNGDFGHHFMPAVIKARNAIIDAARASRSGAPALSAEPTFDYPAAARSIALWLREFEDESLPYPQLIAECARRAAKTIDRLRDALRETMEVAASDSAENSRLRSALAEASADLADFYRIIDHDGSLGPVNDHEDVDLYRDVLKDAIHAMTVQLPDAKRALAAATTQGEAARRDTERLDELEAEVRREALLLKTGIDRVRGGYRGLSIGAPLNRSLREAIDCISPARASRPTEETRP